MNSDSDRPSLPGKPIRVALLGCGTVGGGVLDLLSTNQATITERVGAPIEIAHVLVRDPNKVRSRAAEGLRITTDAESVFRDPDLDVVVEVMGGEEPARSYIERALSQGLAVVSANKYVIAQHGAALLEKAQSGRVDLAFEASVGGGIPIIRTLREALTGDQVLSLHGILNGTSNYILTKMKQEGLSFATALKQAQDLGYAEADPTLDIEGHDAAQKLIVAATLAFGSRLTPDQISVEGITALDAVDFSAAERFGYAIKHLAIGRDLGDAISLRAHPTFVPKSSVVATIDGVLNCVFIQGKALGPCLLVGRGAGDLPTAVSVVADLVDVSRSRREGARGLSTRAIVARPRKLLPLAETVTRYYLRFDVDDTPGVLGTIATALGRHGISIAEMFQEDTSDSQPVSVLMITHETREGDLVSALEEVRSAPFLKSCRFIRIEDL